MRAIVIADRQVVIQEYKEMVMLNKGNREERKIGLERGNTKVTGARRTFRPIDTSQMHQAEYRSYLAVKLQGIKERESQQRSD